MKLTSNLIPTSQLTVQFTWHGNWGTISIRRNDQEVSSFLLREETPENAEALVFMVTQALSNNQWLVVGERLTLDDFEEPEYPGYIGRFMEEEPKEVYDGW